MTRIVEEGGFKVVLLARLSAVPGSSVVELKGIKLIALAGHLTTAVFATTRMGFWPFTIACILTLPKRALSCKLVPCELNLSRTDGRLPRRRLRQGARGEGELDVEDCLVRRAGAHALRIQLAVFTLLRRSWEPSSRSGRAGCVTRPLDSARVADLPFAVSRELRDRHPAADLL